MNSIIIGATGQVGFALSKLIPNAVLGHRTNMDIREYDTMFKAFSEHRPDIVYMPAAFTNVDLCEELSTNKTNVAAAVMVADLCEMFGAKLIYFSSGYVFNGKSKRPYTELEDTDPIQNYGVQKETVEEHILSTMTKYVIIRTIGVFGDSPNNNRNFVKSIAELARHGHYCTAPVDQYMNPISSTDLASITIALSLNHNGIYHVAGDECVSKYEYARRIAKHFGNESKVEGVTSAELVQRAARPRMACLNCSQIERMSITIPSFQKGLSRYLENKYGP